MTDPMRLDAAEIRLILDALRDKYGPGYCSQLDVGRLQAKLSVLLEADLKRRPT